ncbi:MAG: hypothetical protein VXY17_01595 [Verrucomicrobiota bacterium]|nr:hypothetical protein [Verrucomicrobiota bacterium]
MEKIKSLLLPLALVFSAIAVFEFGARYGATNMQAFAIASELQFPLNVFAENKTNMDNDSKKRFAMMIDKGIAAGAMHRQIWHLNRDAQAVLDSLLSYALKVRGDAVTERFASMEASEDMPALNQAKLAKIREALAEAKVDLIDNAPKVAEQEIE